MVKRIFKYISPLWLGSKGKISIRRTLALFFSLGLFLHITYAVLKWDERKNIGDLVGVVSVEAALIAALLSLTTYSNTKDNSITTQKENELKDV